MTEKIYFGIKKTKKFELGEGQYIEFKKLSEGERVSYEDSVNSKILMNQETKMIEIDSKLGADRSKLINAAVCGYSVLFGENAERKDGYDQTIWNELYQSMDSDKAEELHQAILEFNGFKKKETQEK